MKTRKFLTITLSVFLVILYSCVHTSETLVSSHGSMQSSSMSGNCMDCHKTGFTKGAFQIAGTVFTTGGSTNPNGTVYLHSAPLDSNITDSIIAVIEVDGVGNFYTTHQYGMLRGVYPSVTSSTGNKAFMKGPTSSGACNSCHGVTEAKINVD
jgi:hypothetical protein